MIPRLALGQEVTSSLLNRIIEELNSARVVSADFPLERTTSGTKLSMPPRPRSFYAIIKESPERQKENGDVKDGEYEWTEAVLTNEGFGELPGSLASVYDVSTGLLYDPAHELNNNHTVQAGTIVRMWPYPPVEDPDRGFLRRYVFAVGEKALLLWAKAQSDWEENGNYPQGDPRVLVKNCDRLGDNVTGDPFWVYLPRNPRPPVVFKQHDADPYVFKDFVIGYLRDRDGTLICMSPYLHRKKIGELDIITDLNAIPPGFNEADGSTLASPNYPGGQFKLADFARGDGYQPLSGPSTEVGAFPRHRSSVAVVGEAIGQAGCWVYVIDSIGHTIVARKPLDGIFDDSAGDTINLGYGEYPAEIVLFIQRFK